jgi:hypothetical protein
MPRRSNSWGVDASQIEFLLEQFRDVPKELRPAIRKAVKSAADSFVSDVKADASWSSRIPNAVRIFTSFSQSRPGVRVRVDSKRAPHARPYEGLAPGGNRSAFRHPVYGNRDAWVTQSTRPFFRPNVEKHREKVLSAIETALIQTLPRR